MTPLDDHELLAEYAHNGSETAFATLVARYVNLVYSAAERFTGNPHHAEEITQAVFIILAKKAGHLQRDVVLSGWLYQAARLTAANFIKSEMRRQRREQEAGMYANLNEPELDAWEQIAPLLEDAMGQLRETDRNAVVLRFFQNKTAQQVAASLKVNEATAHKRVARALEKLRKMFLTRGISLPVAVIAGAVSVNSVQAAPVGLAKSVSALALAKGAAAGGSTFTLVNTVLKIMAWSNAKSALLLGAGMLLAAGTTTVLVEKARSQPVGETDWKATFSNLSQAPATALVRPTQYTDHVSISDTLGRIIAHNMNFIGLLQNAYLFSPQRMILATRIPAGHFDLVFTLGSAQKKELQNILGRQFGISCRREMRMTEVLCLRMKNPWLLDRHISRVPGLKMDAEDGRGLWVRSNIPSSRMTGFLEAAFNRPVIADPTLSERYDIKFQWSELTGVSAEAAALNLRQTLNEELNDDGLELAPMRQPVEMLIVEKGASVP
jgi:uncharacterized protein (TIGR03435 family)